MSDQATLSPVRRSVTVAAPPERAFEVFTSGFGSWWPSSHSIVEGGWGTAIVEPREGGRWYERGASGAECDWGRVVAYEPPRRLVLTWQLDGQYRFDPDEARASEIEILFTPDGDGTRVELEHRGFERRGGVDGAATAESVGGENGWSGLLELYARAAGA